MGLIINPRQIIKDGITSLRDVWSSSKVSTELSGKQATLVSGTNIKTINNTSLLGSGDITISGGGGEIPKINMTATTATLDPNKFYVWGEVASLDISLAAETAGIENVYKFQFQSGDVATTLSLPADVKWSDSKPPFLRKDSTFIISIESGIASVERFYSNILVPEEYQQVEWLGTNQTTNCWINTNVPATSDYAIEATISMRNNAYGGQIGYIADSGNWSRGDMLLCVASSSHVQYGFSLFSGGISHNYRPYDNNKHFIAIYPDKHIFDDNVTTFTLQSYTYAYNINLFATKIAIFDESNNRSSINIYRCAILNVSTLQKVRDFVPCYRKADSVAGMYDIVNDVFYTNNSTGTFIVGPDV